MEFKDRLLKLNDHPFYSKINFDELRESQSLKDMIHSIPITTKEDLMSNIELWTNEKFTINQNTGGTSGKQTTIRMTVDHAIKMLQTFYKSFSETGNINSNFKKFDPTIDKYVCFYPRDAYFTNLFERVNYIASITNYISFGYLFKLLDGTIFSYVSNFKMVGFHRVDLESVTRLVEYLNSEKPRLLIIFPFVLYKISEIIKRYNLKLEYQPELINISGEFVEKCSIDFIKTIFTESTINSTYGMVEFGEVAHQYEHNGEYHVFDDFYVEKSDDNKLIISSLYQTTFPLLRYKTEDIITDIIEIDGKQVIKKVIGKNTQFLSNGIGPSQIDNIVNELNNTNEIKILCYKLLTDADENNFELLVVIDSNILDLLEYSTIVNNEFSKLLLNFKLTILDEIKHDYLKKFKVIEHKEIDDEPVGGVENAN